MFNYENAEGLASHIEKLPEEDFVMSDGSRCIAGQARRIGLASASGSEAIVEAIGCTEEEADRLYGGYYTAVGGDTPRAAAAALRELAIQHRKAESAAVA